MCCLIFFFFFSSRRRHTRFDCDWSSDVCSSDLRILVLTGPFLVDQVARVVPQIPRAQIFAEPRAASTAPPLTWAAHWISQRDPGAQMLSLHADWAVSDDR